MAEQLQGIEHLKRGAKFTINLANQCIDSGKDGFSWTDCFSFVDDFVAGALIAKDAKEIIAEIKELSKEERAELEAYIQAEFDLADDKVEAIVEDSLNIAFSLLSLIEKIKQ